MDIDQARPLAEAKLREIEDPATPLTLSAPDAPRDFGWAWGFSYNSVRYLETKQFSDLVPSGPIIVLKDRSDVWVANSAPPVEQWLNMYAEQHGLPTLPLPQAFSF